MLVITSHLYLFSTKVTVFSVRQLGATAGAEHAWQQRDGRDQSVKFELRDFPQSSSFCLNSFVTDLEIITSAPCTVPHIDLARGIETRQKTRQGEMVELLR